MKKTFSERLSINRVVAQKGRFQTDREIPQSASHDRLHGRRDPKTRAAIIRRISKMYASKVYDSSPDSPRKSRTSEIAHKTARLYESEMATQERPKLRDDHEALTSVYHMRRDGLSEMQVAARLGKKLGRQVRVDGLFHNADHEINMSRPDYHSPNSWHPSMTHEEIAQIYKLRSQGKTDHQIKYEMGDEKDKNVGHSMVRYNADHFHAYKLASSQEFQDKHGIGYVPPNAGQIGRKKKFELTGEHTKKIKAYLQHSPGASQNEIRRHLRLPTTANKALSNHLKGEGIELQKKNTGIRANIARPQEFHQRLHDMVHKHGMTNPEIIAKSKSELGVHLTKGMLVGYLHRTDIGPNPNTRYTYKSKKLRF
jgi:hypothetical protein